MGINIISQLAALLDKNKERAADPATETGEEENEKAAFYETTSKEEPQEQISEEEYQNRLDKSQRILKEQVVMNHEFLEEESISRLLMKLKSNVDNIEALFITDKDFNNLFIFTNIDRFLSLVQKMEMNIDFTYLYALTKGGPEYYGIDEYTSEITHLFENLGDALKSGMIQSPKDVQKIKNINIFHHIYTDFL